MKTNRFLLAFLFSAAFILTTAISAQTVQANNVDVFLDGVRLNFTYVQPQIINDRTMVPLRETAAHFGMEATWDEATATMVFTAPGRTMVHTVFTDTIQVNDTSVRFPGMPSMIVHDRTLMSIRMLGEAIGHIVEWDPAGIVNIWTDAPPAQQPPADPGVPAVADIVVFSAAPAVPNNNFGEPVTIRVATNYAADRVRLTDTQGNELATVNQFTYDTEGRYFNLNITPAEYGEITLRVYAGNAGGFVTTPRNVTFNVAPPIPDNHIILERLNLSGTTADRNRFEPSQTVYGTVRTSNDVVRIRVEDSAGRAVDNNNRHLNAFGVFFSWEIEFRAPSTAGTHTYRVYAFDRNDDYNYLSFDIIVVGPAGNVVDDAATGHLVTVNNISDVSSIRVRNDDGEDNDVRMGDRVVMTIVTSNNITEVEVLHDYSGGQLDRTTNFTPSGSNRIWQLIFHAHYPDANYYLSVWLDTSGGQRITRRIHGFSVRT